MASEQLAPTLSHALITSSFGPCARAAFLALYFEEKSHPDRSRRHNRPTQRSWCMDEGRGRGRAMGGLISASPSTFVMKVPHYERAACVYASLCIDISRNHGQTVVRPPLKEKETLNLIETLVQCCVYPPLSTLTQPTIQLLADSRTPHNLRQNRTHNDRKEGGLNDGLRGKLASRAMKGISRTYVIINEAKQKKAASFIRPSVRRIGS